MTRPDLSDTSLAGSLEDAAGFIRAVFDPADRERRDAISETEGRDLARRLDELADALEERKARHTDDGRPFAYHALHSGPEVVMARVVGGVDGYYPLAVFPGTYEEAKADAHRRNDELGWSRLEADQIIASSLTASRRKEAEEQLERLSRAVHRFARQYRDGDPLDATAMDLLGDAEAHSLPVYDEDETDAANTDPSSPAVFVDSGPSKLERQRTQFQLLLQDQPAATTAPPGHCTAYPDLPVLNALEHGFADREHLHCHEDPDGEEGDELCTAPVARSSRLDADEEE